MADRQKKLLLIDGNSLLFRAYYATIKQPLTDQHGQPTNAVYSFARMLQKYFKQNRYDSISVTFDKSKKTFRHDLLGDYKAGRKKTPDDLVSQFSITREFLQAAGVVFYEEDGYEADDLIGTIARVAKEANWLVDILSSDHDLLQLINEQTNVILVKNFSTSVRMDQQRFVEEYEFTPDLLIDFKGLKGDSSDNLKGMKGIGTKTATELIKKYQTLENIFAHSKEQTKRVQTLLENETEQANGLLSKQLATIIIDVPLHNINLDPLTVNWQKLNAFFLKYNMKSLVQNYDIHVPKQPTEITFIYAKCSDIQIAEDNYLIAHENKTTTVVNKNGCWTLCNDELTKTKTWNQFCHNAQFKKHGFDIKSQTKLIPHMHLDNWDDDVAVIGYIVNTKLNPTIEAHSCFFLQTTIDLPATKLKEQNSSVFNYNEKKSKCVQDLHLFHHQKTLQNKTFAELYKTIDRPIINLLAKMEKNGIKVDLVELAEQEQNAEQQIASLTSHIHTMTNQKFNINSPQQLAKVLYEDLALPRYQKNSTAQSVLEKLIDQHPVISLILTYRKWQQMQSNYLQGLKKYVTKNDFIHCSFAQITVDTGRISCTQPNLQSIALHDNLQRNVRKVFIPRSKDNIFLSFDYSQIELRIWSFWSKDPVLQQAFQAKEDIHKTVASQMYQVPLTAVTDEMRSAAKAVNFGIMYGLQPFGLANMLKTSLEEAKMFLELYQAKYPSAVDFKNNQITKAKASHYATTWFGRQRLVDEFNEKIKWRRQFAERVAVNSPIQGTASDLLKKSLLAVDKCLTAKYPNAFIINQIHDEIMLEVPKAKASIISADIKQIMEHIVDWPVALQVHCNQGQNWYDLK